MVKITRVLAVILIVLCVINVVITINSGGETRELLGWIAASLFSVMLYLDRV